MILRFVFPALGIRISQPLSLMGQGMLTLLEMLRG